MKAEEFDVIVENRINSIRTVLVEKAKEYSSPDDRFHNFNVAARIINTSPEKALLGMVLKHLVSVLDMIDYAEKTPERLTIPLIDEKCGDLCNYILLLEGLLKERISKIKEE